MPEIKDAVPVASGAPAFGCAVLAETAGVVPAGADLGEDSRRSFARCAPAGGFAVFSDGAGMPIAGVDRDVASLGDGGVVVAACASPAMSCAGVSEGAGVVVAGADLDVAVGRGGWESRVALGVGDAQSCEEQECSEGERREEVSTPPPRRWASAHGTRRARWSVVGIRASDLGRTAHTLYQRGSLGSDAPSEQPPMQEAPSGKPPMQGLRSGKPPTQGGRRFQRRGGRRGLPLVLATPCRPPSPLARTAPLHRGAVFRRGAAVRKAPLCRGAAASSGGGVGADSLSRS